MGGTGSRGPFSPFGDVRPEHIPPHTSANVPTFNYSCSTCLCLAHLIYDNGLCILQGDPFGFGEPEAIVSAVKTPTPRRIMSE